MFIEMSSIPLSRYCNKTPEISFYFYSTNSSSFKTESGYPKQNFSWNLSSWPNYLVWDDYQKDFVNREITRGSNAGYQ